MNFKPPFLKYLLLFIGLILTKTLYANEGLPYVFIQYNDKEILELKLSKDFSIQHHAGVLEINSGSAENNLSLPLDSVSLIGFLYKEKEEDAGLNSIIGSQTNGVWQIFDLEGRLIRETRSDTPDLNNLPAGKIFIIKNGSSSFKFVPYK